MTTRIAGIEKLRWGIMLAATVILCWQVLIPPVVGLASQSDFGRMLGPFGYSAEDKTALFGFLAQKFVHDSSGRVRDWEQVGSEYIFVAAAIELNKVVSKDGKLDITVMGLVHMLAFLLAFYRLLRAIAPFRAAPLIWILALVILTDVGYAAYWNSFFAEPASCIFFLLLLAETIPICRTGEMSTWQAVCWAIFATLFVMAKLQNAPLGILLALLALRMRPWSKSPAAGLIAIGGSLLVIGASVFNLLTGPVTIERANTYNQIFLAILPESKNPVADAQALGLPPDWVKYSGIGAWGPGTNLQAAEASGLIGQRITLATVVRFYLLRPARLWRHATEVLRVGFSLRPPDLGNFERSAGLPIGARSTAFGLWSTFHEKVLPRAGRVILIALMVCPIICLGAWLRIRRDPAGRKSPVPRYLEFFGLLSICCVLAFFTAIVGDAWENVKHLFLFNLLLDCLVIASVAVVFQSARNALYSL